MHATIKTWQEKKQDQAQRTIAGAIIFTLGLCLFLTPIMMLANQL